MLGTWNNLIGVVKESAPTLGSAISKANPVAGMAISLISQAFGANKNDENDILNKITSDPEYKLKLKKIEFDHQESLSQIDSQDYKTKVDDRKNARDKQIDLKDWIPTFLAMVFLINYAAMQFYCVTHANSSNDIISARFQDVLMLIMSYYYGSMHTKNDAN